MSPIKISLEGREVLRKQAVKSSRRLSLYKDFFSCDHILILGMSFSSEKEYGVSMNEDKISYRHECVRQWEK